MRRRLAWIRFFRLLQLTPYPLDALLLTIVYLNRITQLTTRGTQNRFLPLLPYKPKTIRFDHKQASSEPSLSFTTKTAHRLLLSAIALAAKYTSDAYITTIRAAKVAGVSVKELHKLELELFTKLAFNCFVQAEELESVCQAIWPFTSDGKEEMMIEGSGDADYA